MRETRPDLWIAPHAPASAARDLDHAAAGLAAALRTLDADARRVAPWLGDPVSADAAARYTRYAATGPDAALEQVRALHDALCRARDALTATAREYRGVEDTVTRYWGPR